MDLTEQRQLTLDDLYQAHEHWLRNFAVSLAEDPFYADDLVQETFMRAIAYLPMLGNLKPYQRRAWLRRVLKNLFLDGQRSQMRQHILVNQLVAETEWYQDDVPGMIAYEVLELVSDSDRDLLIQRYLLGMNSNEIGRELRISAGTVRARLHLAIKRIRARIQLSIGRSKHDDRS
jgi:RNA polymerase sigma-70 factor (ECF subfamily)